MPGTGKEALFAIYGWKEGMKWQKSAAKTMDCRRRCFTTKKDPGCQSNRDLVLCCLLFQL
jgi:hypothetical protein